MDHDRHRRVRERPGIDQIDLASVELLGGGTEDGDPNPQLLGEVLATPRPAPRAEVAMMLCPQAWPTPGRASYSAQITTSGPVDPVRATNAVSSP